jgi:hypothetical protein
MTSAANREGRMPVAGDDGPKVIPWQKDRGLWGVTYRRAGRRVAYGIGNKVAAESEATRIGAGKSPLWGPDAAKPEMDVGTFLKLF